MHQAWLLISDQAINVIRNALVQKLGKLDTLFIVDATHNKAAWFNFGPNPTLASAACGPRSPIRSRNAARANQPPEFLAEALVVVYIAGRRHLQPRQLHVVELARHARRSTQGSSSYRETPCLRSPSELAPTRQFAPIRLRLSKVEPMPISEPSAMVVECRITR